MPVNHVVTPELLLFGSLILLSGCRDSSQAAGKGSRNPAAPPVRVAAAVRQEVPLEITAIGNIEPWSRVEVKSQVAGQLQRVYFTEGQDVKQGTPLFLIDPRTFEQAVREAEAALGSARAALAQAEANYQRDTAQAKNARAQSKRYSELATQGIIAREQDEQFRTAAVAAEKGAEAAKAAIESARAAVQGVQAKLGDARLQLSYTTIRAPISGRTGSLSVKPGNLVAANAADPLVVINQITPVFATFSIPEGSLDELRRHSSGRKLRVAAKPSQAEGPPAQGTLDFLDNEVDPATGTIRLKAQFANADRRLWPGQFVNVSIQLATETATVVPSAAVQTAQTGSYVFVVKPDNTAEQRNVEPRRAWSGLIVVAGGVSPGERVVVDGQLRVKPGTKVQVLGGEQGREGSRTRTAETPGSDAQQ